MGCGAQIAHGAAAMTEAEGEVTAAAGPGTFPEVIGYKIESLIARGGMGEVYRARQVGLDRYVALKLIAPELGSSVDFQRRFAREAKVAASIDHPNILPVYEAGEASDGRLFISMKLSTGEDLDDYLKREGPLSLDAAWPILEQVGAAIDAAHADGLIHRDIKPRNVLVEQSQSGEVRVFLTDFGLARLNDSDSFHTVTGEVMGTVDYMAPEQVEGEAVDQRVDIYAFGCLMFRVLSGSVPFPRETKRETLAAHASATPPRLANLLPGTPHAVDAAVGRMLAKDPKDRGDSVVAILAEAREGSRRGPETAVMAASSGERRVAVEVAWRLPLFAAMFIAGYLGGASL